MTCQQFLTVACSGRSFDELTRAERSALVAHAMSCARCLVLAVTVFAGELMENPASAMADVAAGKRQSRADRAAADPEC